MLWHASMFLGLRHVLFFLLFPFPWWCPIIFLVKTIFRLKNTYIYGHKARLISYRYVDLLYQHEG
jgi:hypothetical protein